MRVRKLDKNGDWTFGQGMANYIKDTPAVAQNVVTRIKSFRNDWFLNVMAEIDWFSILSNRTTDQVIINEVRRVCKATYGVQSVNNIELISTQAQNEAREANITVSITTIFGDNITESIGVSYG